VVAKLLAFCSVANAMLCCVHAYAQNSQTSGPNPPANLWMTIPISWAPASDSVPSSVRQQRDKYFDELIGLGVPLTPANVRSTGFSEGVPSPNQQEIPQLPNRTVVIGTFDSYQPVLSKSGRAIYTEATFFISNVFQDAAGDVRPGGHLILIINGGTVQTEAGVVLSFLTQPRSVSVHVGRTYLLAISYEPMGDFYRLGKTWDLADGVVKANFSTGPRVPSTLAGMSVQQLVVALDAQFGIQ
jgi:hypothetical protein